MSIEIRPNPEVLHYFHLQDYEKYGLVGPPQDPKLCVKTSTEPSFVLCCYDPTVDKYVSGDIMKYGLFEKQYSDVLKKLLQSHPSALFLNIGANLGNHALFGAALGHQVWAVEPTPNSMIRLFRSAILSNLSQNLTLLLNGVDGERRKAWMKIDETNKGGSFVKLKTQNVTGNDVELQLVLFSDILDAVILKHNPEDIYIMIDIELYECRAFLGSKDALANKAIKVIMMEFKYIRMPNQNDINQYCNQSQAMEMIDMFLNYGFLPHKLDSFGQDLREISHDVQDSAWSGGMDMLFWLKPEIKQAMKG